MPITRNGTERPREPLLQLSIGTGCVTEYAVKYREANPPKPYTPDKSSRTGSASVYKVKKGDTLGKIASRNGTTVAKLCKLNGLKTTSTLQIGQKLKLH